MRKLVLVSAIAAAALVFGGASAHAQQKAAPGKAHGAGAECSRMTDTKARDECVREAQQKSGQNKEHGGNSKGKGSSAHDMPKGKK